MLTAVLVYVLTVLAAVVVVLTRKRLRSGSRESCALQLAGAVVTTHTIAGGLALVSWTTFLLVPESVGENAVTLIGLFALICWWVTVLAGLLILLRWLPGKGRHAGPGAADSWSQGPALSVLAHVGLLVGVVVFTYAYLVSAV
ncbi:hypothetical protein [Nocardioides sp.]|uniref:hypothetical protein n=1 Tax=Nocardioides sp. TaxID=35761 RepID=UPI002B26EEC5|nr:hypothetical protein [Nocardioides sp.]